MTDMKKIRIGNDVAFAWTIKVGGSDHDLEGKILKLYVSSGCHSEEITDFTVDGNTVSSVFPGIRQKFPGIYALTLVENPGSSGMMTIDCCGAFQLVDWTCLEGCTPDGSLVLESNSAACPIVPVIPTIGENGHWFVDGVDTGKPAYIPTGQSVPVFDLLRSRQYITEYNFPGTDPESSGYVRDVRPCLRFLGQVPGPGWSVEVYIYRNKKNKGFKKVLSSPVSECEAPSDWIGGRYQTVVLPWSLMRIFWEMFDPVANGNNIFFHDNDYDVSAISQAWFTKSKNGAVLAKRGGLANTCSSRSTGALFSGTFGIRIGNETAGCFGELRIFRITLNSLNQHDTQLIFNMKIDSGTTVQTSR